MIQSEIIDELVFNDPTFKRYVITWCDVNVIFKLLDALSNVMWVHHRSIVKLEEDGLETGVLGPVEKMTYAHR
jgi:hypothetical protein